MPVYGVSMSTVGVSIVHTGHEELLYLSGHSLTADVILSQKTAKAELQLASLQMDNQQASATLPTILSLSASAKEEEEDGASGGAASLSHDGGGGGVAGGSSSSSSSAAPPAVHLSVVKNLRVAGSAVDWWDYVSFRLLEMDVALEPPLLQAMLEFALAARLEEFIQLVIELDDRAKDERQLERRGPGQVAVHQCSRGS